LAQDTRISTAVLEALERGWRDRLPEPTYLRTMLPLLERHLGLPPLSLQGALPALPNRFQATPSRPPLLRRFTPGSIEVFTSWQGTLLYGLVTLALVHLLNLQQFRLAERGLLSARPMPELANPRAAATAQTDAALLDAFPDLQPTSQAAAGLGLRRLRQEGGGGAVDLSLGVLELSAPSPTRVELRSSRGGDSRLVGVQGELALPVLPPFQLRLDPEPGGGTVRWRGQPLAPITGKPGSFRYPPAAAAPAAPRP
jgi:hypothetical protein